MLMIPSRTLRASRSIWVRAKKGSGGAAPFITASTSEVTPGMSALAPVRLSPPAPTVASCSCSMPR